MDELIASIHNKILDGIDVYGIYICTFKLYILFTCYINLKVLFDSLIFKHITYISKLKGL